MSTTNSASASWRSGVRHSQMRHIGCLRVLRRLVIRRVRRAGKCARDVDHLVSGKQHTAYFAQGL